MADDWWDQLYADDEPAPEPESEPKRRTPRTWRRTDAEPDRTRVRVEVTHPRKHQERETVRDAARALLPNDPRQARRWQLVAYNGSAALVGWWAGIGSWMTDGMASADSVSEGVFVGLGLAGIAAAVELRTHAFRDPGRHVLIRAVGWALRIPLASALLALALFTPDAAL